jgi:antitoxin Phd
MDRLFHALLVAEDDERAEPVAEFERAGARRLATLTEEFDALLARMQQPEMPARLKAAFASSPETIGRAAVKAEKTP